MQIIMNFSNYIREYGLKLFISKAVRHFFFKYNSRLAWKINEVNQLFVESKLSEIFDSGKVEIPLPPQSINVSDNIWVMWWQGEKKAPEIVRFCIDSIRKNAGERSVIVISEENFSEYINFPDFIIEKFESGLMSKTHFSDIVRLYLLYMYGGLWIDSTVFVSKKIPDYIFEYDFYSCKFGKETKDPSKGRWTTFLMSSKKRNKFIGEVLYYHLLFWNKHSIIIDYIMFDYIIDYVCKNNIDYENMITKVPENNSKVFDLVNMLNDICEEDWCFNDLAHDTFFYKLSYKKEVKKSINGEKTIFGKLVEETSYEKSSIN